MSSAGLHGADQPVSRNEEEATSAAGHGGDYSGPHKPDSLGVNDASAEDAETNLSSATEMLSGQADDKVVGTEIEPPRSTLSEDPTPNLASLQAPAAPTITIESQPQQPDLLNASNAPIAGPSNAINDVYSTPPSIRKRRMPPGGPKGILKPAPPPSKTFSFRRDILQSLNTRLAQGGVGVQVPVPAGSSLSALSGSAQGTAQAAGNLIGGVFKRLGGLAAGVAVPGMGVDEQARSASRPFASSNTGAPSQRGGVALNSPTSTSSPASSAFSEASLLPTNTLPAPASSPRPLRRVQFRVNSMRITYPIHGSIAPGDEDATRKRVEKEHREWLRQRKEMAWAVPELEKLYRECCRTREEYPLKKMRAVFEDAQRSAPPALRTMDLSFVPLDRAAIEPISDLLSIDFSLQKLVLENCGLTDDGLKSILHALLVSGTLPTLSLAANRRIKYHGWRFVGIFMRRARALRYLDLSENSINKASLEHITGAIARSTPLLKGSADNEDSKDASAPEGKASDAGRPGMDDIVARHDEFDDEAASTLQTAATTRLWCQGSFRCAWKIAT
ncbi:Predicted myosin-I-binding protein [Ceraceosorus bombacis]|uniref:Predicted myosin-I-binding protein n=1 Tax=Ceraceosorus bombacis TaxID=401625 RepID=A0A0P1BN06_9BASI|nr:Predicted myosin-I-binding protein [Ceraceosorus bombacis]